MMEKSEMMKRMKKDKGDIKKDEDSGTGQERGERGGKRNQVWWPWNEQIFIEEKQTEEDREEAVCESGSLLGWIYDRV